MIKATSISIFLPAALLAVAALTAQAQDVVQVSPKTNKVLVENDYVRIVQATFKPGAKEPMHTHPAGWYYVTKGGTLKVTYADGKVENWSPKTSEQEWSDGEAAHSAENIGKSTLQYLLVEVKNAPNKAAAAK